MINGDYEKKVRSLPGDFKRKRCDFIGFKREHPFGKQDLQETLLLPLPTLYLISKNKVKWLNMEHMEK
jgi:hypothetical protein